MSALDPLKEALADAALGYFDAAKRHMETCELHMAVIRNGNGWSELENMAWQAFIGAGCVNAEGAFDRAEAFLAERNLRRQGKK